MELNGDAQQTAARPRNNHISNAKHGKKAKKGKQNSDELSPTDRAVVREFRNWLCNQPGAAVEEARAFKAIMLYARALGIDPNTPDGIEDLIHPAREFDDPETSLTSLVLMRDYARFHLDRDKDDAWETAVESVTFALETLQTKMTLGAVNQAGLDLDSDVRRRACAQTLVVSKVAQLLEWLGDGRKVTVSGALRRADIAEVAAMLGIAAVGTNKRPAGSDGSAIYARSMSDVPVLDAWWGALEMAGLTYTISDRVRPGPFAAHWSDKPLPPLEPAEMLIGMFIILVIGDWPTEPSETEDEGMWLTLAHLVAAVSPNASLVSNEGNDPVVVELAMSKLRQLEQVGVVNIDESGEVTVPLALQGVMAHSLLVTLDELEDAD